MYLIGNPIIYWANLACFVAIGLVVVIRAVLRQRGLMVNIGATASLGFSS